MSRKEFLAWLGASCVVSVKSNWDLVDHCCSSLAVQTAMRISLIQFYPYSCVLHWSVVIRKLILPLIQPHVSLICKQWAGYINKDLLETIVWTLFITGWGNTKQAGTQWTNKLLWLVNIWTYCHQLIRRVLLRTLHSTSAQYNSMVRWIFFLIIYLVKQSFSTII